MVSNKKLVLIHKFNGETVNENISDKIDIDTIINIHNVKL